MSRRSYSVQLKLRGRRGSFFDAGGRWLAQQSLNMFAKRAAGGRLKIIAIGCQHFVKRVSGSQNHFRDEPGMLLGEFRRQEHLPVREPVH